MDVQSTRTEITLGDGESAVIEKIPVSLISRVPVNVQVIEFDQKHLSLITSLAPNQIQEIELSNTDGTEAILTLDSSGKLKLIK